MILKNVTVNRSGQQARRRRPGRKGERTMKNKVRRRAAAFIASIVLIAAIVAAVLMICTPVQAETVNGGIFTNTGLQRYHGHFYFIKENGEVSRDSFRVYENKVYYFGKDGRLQTRDSHYIDIRSKDHSVRYIYTPGTKKRQRYNTALKRYQVKHGRHWISVGMQCIPYGQFDMEP